MDWHGLIDAVVYALAAAIAAFFGGKRGVMKHEIGARHRFEEIKRAMYRG